MESLVSGSKHHQVSSYKGGASSFSFGWGEPVVADKPKGKAKVSAPEPKVNSLRRNKWHYLRSRSTPASKSISHLEE